jgi:hypothetical protein
LRYDHIFAVVKSKALAFFAFSIADHTTEIDVAPTMLAKVAAVAIDVDEMVKEVSKTA